MPHSPRIQPQNPDLSPTYNLSQSSAQNNASIPASIRRNLFAGHLSRRPIPSEMRPAASHTPDPFQTQSPPRPAQPRADIFQSQPTLEPSVYGANVSPSRSLSPSNDARFFPSSSIVAVSPQTGRPLLPAMPTLPPRLRLSDGDEDDNAAEDAAADDDDEHTHTSPAAAYRHPVDYPSHYRASHHHHHDDSSSLLMSMRPPGADYELGLHPSFMDGGGGGAASDSRDLERIEQLLSKMQAQQREKAIETYAVHAAGMGASSKVSTRARGKARATSRNTADTSTGAETKLGGVGATIDPVEKDEMLGLIMTSLRKKVQQADEEGWMYGVDAPGAYSDEVGVYE